MTAQEALPATLGALAILALSTRFLPGSTLWNEEWRSRVDVPLAGALATAGALLNTFWMIPRSYSGYPVWASSFTDYCDLVAGQAAGLAAGKNNTRSTIGAWLPAQWAPSTGTVDALTLYGILGLFLIFAGIYLWARFAHGRTAGVLAVIAAFPIPAVLHNARDITFYPAVNGSAVVLAAAVVAMARYPGWAPALLAGISAGMLLILDVRGLMLGLAFLACAIGLAVVRATNHKVRALRLLLVLAPVLLSWNLAGRFQNPNLIGLWPQSQFYVDEVARQAKVEPWWANYDVRPLPPPGKTGPVKIECDFQWGRGTPSELLCAVRRMSEFNRGVPDQVRTWSEAERFQASHFWPWVAPVATGLLLALGALRKRPWQALAMVATVAPFAYLYVNMGRMLPQLRFLSLYALAIPVVFGVALAALAEPIPGTNNEKHQSRFPFRGALLAAAMAAIVVWKGGWFVQKMGFVNETDPQNTLLMVVAGRGAEAGPGNCASLLADEMARGLPVEPSFYPKAAGPKRGN